MFNFGSSMRVSFIATVYNEESSVRALLESLFCQSKFPDEIIIVDGGSSDQTIAKIKDQVSKIKNYRGRFKILIKKGNRSIGRNEAIKNAKNEIIACSDAGCILDKNWIKNITKPFRNPKVDVVAGYYQGIARSIFQKCLIPYVLVMPDKVNPKSFLPASRSVAFKKSIWEKAGRFDEKLSHNEDFVFANKLKNIKAKIVFEKNAITKWIPRQNLPEAFRMFFRFAFGDSESKIFRNSVSLLFARYLFYFYLVILAFLEKSTLLWCICVLLPIAYVCWSMRKNYKYINSPHAFVFLPVLQFASDVAVLSGTILGVIKLVSKINYKKFLKSNLISIGLIAVYVISMVFVINLGIPGYNHPFPYQMDEWHQLQSVRFVFTKGTPNLPGAANGTMFHFFYSGILLAPFILFKLVNPAAIKSAVDTINIQHTLFILLRLNTILFGVLTLMFISKIAKLLKLNSYLAMLLLFVTPIWLVLSNFFKYDIALVFWITLSLYFLLKYYYLPNLKNFILGSLFAGVAFSVKVTGLTLVPIVILTYFLFTSSIRKNIRHLILGLLIFVSTSIFLGIPDIVFGGRNMSEYLCDNLISILAAEKNYNLHMSLFDLNFLHKFPGIFGHPLYFITVVAFFYLMIHIIINLISGKYKKIKHRLFLLVSFCVFLLSLLYLGIFLAGNRAIVLLPFIVILDLFFLKDLYSAVKNKIFLKRIVLFILGLLFTIQVFESYLWLNLKRTILPQQASSRWILANIPFGSDIGLENIPIYQHEPDFIIKEFYLKQYHSNFKTRFLYSVVNSKSDKLPLHIIISDVYYEKKYYKRSDKLQLVKRLKNEGYKETAYFPLKVPYYYFFDSNSDYPYMGLTVYPQGISIFKK